MSLNLSKNVSEDTCSYIFVYIKIKKSNAINWNSFTERSPFFEHFEILKYFENLTTKLFNCINEWMSPQHILSFSRQFRNYYENSKKDILCYFLFVHQFDQRPKNRFCM